MATINLAVSDFKAVCKLRWVPKSDTDQMTIANIEALKLMAGGIMAEGMGDYAGAAAAKASAKEVLDKELEQYLSGIQHTIQISPSGLGMGDVGARRL